MYDGVMARHPGTKVIVPPRSSAVPSETAETAPTQRDRHLQLVAARGRMCWQKASGYNDRALVAAARDKAVALMEASGARKVHVGLMYAAHAMGGCRMGDDPRTSVVNSLGQSHDVPNLFVCDTSVFVTSAGVNPTLTAMALASRSSGHIAAALRRGDV